MRPLAFATLVLTLVLVACSSAAEHGHTAGAVETLRDYHRDVDVDGDPTTDTYDNLPDDVRRAVDRLDAYAVEHCESFQVPEGVDAHEREAEEASLDPDRIECAPAGCEVWRRPLGGLPPVPQWVAGSPVVIEDEQLVGLDLDTGEVRWQLRINDELVAIANTRGVQLVSQSGQMQWARSLPAERAHLSWVHVTATSLVVVHELPPDLASTGDVDSGDEVPLEVAITVMDTRDGLRWSREGSQRVFTLPTLADQQELLLVEGDTGTISALDLMSGEPRYELPGGPDLWPYHAGEILTFGDFHASAADTSRLFAAADGTVRAELLGAVRALLDMDERRTTPSARRGSTGAIC